MDRAAGVASLLSQDNLAFIQQGVSISVASRDVRLVPSLTRALGCRLSDDGLQLRIMLVRSQSQDVIRDVEKSGAIAVVFTQPTTHRTLQIKGYDAGTVPFEALDQDCIARSRTAFTAEIAQLGFPVAFTERLYGVAAEDLVVITFTPENVFQQTPGPDAGALLEPAT